MNQQYKQYYRAADAALNRALEGLRVCEDTARFITCDFGTAADLKSLRHKTADASKIFALNRLLDARDISGDENRSLTETSENLRLNSVMLVRANIRRAAEAVRTLEELYKLRVFTEETSEDVNPFKTIRFEIYDVEKKQIKLLLKKNKTDSLYGSLYAIIDSGCIKDGKYAETASQMIEGGARVVQLRMKNSTQREKLTAAKEIAPLCNEAGVLFIVNDDSSIALLSKADGVHVGTNDLPCDAVSSLLPYDNIVGTSNNSTSAARESVIKGADYIAVGPVFSTETKTGEKLKGRGVDLIKEIRKETELPLVAIGGIEAESASELVKAGADSLAVISALYRGDNIRSNCEEIAAIIKREYKQKT